MLVYREPTRSVSGSAAKQALTSALRRLDRDPIGDCSIEALLRAGELECALADLGHPNARGAADVTNALACHVLVDNGPPLNTIERNLRGLQLPQQLTFKTPEGYAYHGLDPRQYAALAESIDVLSDDRPVAVVGIRSIGTSLGAVVSETLRLRGMTVDRISVRPTGHPWARVLRLDRHEAAFVEQMCACNAQFLVVDEGPYASGSTFLAVAEGLERTGVPCNSIILCASRLPDPSRLLAKAAAERWARYRCYAAAPWRRMTGAEDLSYGAWRKRVYGDDASAWPACWVQFERIKRLSADGQWLDKYEGLAPYRDAPFERACAAAHAGYAPAPTWLGHGFVRYPWLSGRPAQATDLDAAALRDIARYCAFRAREFRCEHVDPQPLHAMVQTNLDEVFGFDIGDRVRFEVEVPIVPDAKMQPYEWIISLTGRWTKTDGHAHGDGPLLPGPTDVCWDLAGAIVEWQMNDTARDRFVSDYARLAGDDPSKRLPAYLIGYCAQRLGETYVAAATGSDPAEQARHKAAHDRYRATLERWFNVPRTSARAQQRERRMTMEYSARPNAA